MPAFDLVPSDVEGFMEELWAFQSAFHDCFARSEPRAYFFDSMVLYFPLSWSEEKATSGKQSGRVRLSDLPST